MTPTLTDRLSVKQFYAEGHAAIESLEEGIMDWLDDTQGAEVIDISSNLCASDGPPLMVVLVWYRYLPEIPEVVS